MSPVSLYGPNPIWFGQNVLHKHDEQKITETGDAGIELHLLTLEDYNRLAGTAVSLKPGEILFHNNQGVTEIPLLQVGSGGPVYSVREELRAFPTQPNNKHVQDLVYTVVLCDELEASALSAALSGLDAEEATGRVLERFLFIGIFIGDMFLMATVLIIYYKQVSEGYQDRVRFEILQKVGMDRHEVGSTIRRQILMVFFLPLAGAVVHLGFSFGFLPKMLALFGLYNVPLYVCCAVLTLAVYALLYLAVFALTARAYGRLVRFDAESA